MRQLKILLLALALVAPAGLVAAQVPQVFPRQPNDLRAEYVGNTGPVDDPNGLPPASNTVDTLILDSKGRWNVPAVTNQHGNENIVPLLFADESGDRTRSFLLPGTTGFHAWYGLFRDKDDDRSIDATNDTADEWTGYGADKAPGGVYGFITPGYYPTATSDYWLLGDWIFVNESQLETQPDFRYVAGADGNWTGSSVILMDTGSLLDVKYVHTVANGLLAPTTEYGYTCPDTVADCLVDIDRYDVLNEDVASLYASALAIVADADRQLGDAIGPAFDAIDPVIELIGDVSALTDTNRDAENETDPANPTASMTVAHGAPRGPGGYDYQSGPHAYVDASLSYYVTEPNSFYLGGPPFSIPEGDDTPRGLAPQMIGLSGLVGLWHDENQDYGLEYPEEFTGSCDLIDTTTGKNVNLTATLTPVDDDGNPTTWGPAGAYVLREADGKPDVEAPILGGLDVNWYDEMVLDATDFDLERHVINEPVTMQVFCDADDPAEWGSAAWEGATMLLLPMGTFGFNIKLETPDGLALKFRDGNSIEQIEASKDVDFYERWA